MDRIGNTRPHWGQAEDTSRSKRARIDPELQHAAIVRTSDVLNQWESDDSLTECAILDIKVALLECLLDAHQTSLSLKRTNAQALATMPAEVAENLAERFQNSQVRSITLPRRMESIPPCFSAFATLQNLQWNLANYSGQSLDARFLGPGQQLHVSRSFTLDVVTQWADAPCSVVHANPQFVTLDRGDASGHAARNIDWPLKQMSWASERLHENDFSDWLRHRSLTPSRQPDPDLNFNVTVKRDDDDDDAVAIQVSLPGSTDDEPTSLSATFAEGNLHIELYESETKGRNMGREMILRAILGMGYRKVDSISATLGMDNEDVLYAELAKPGAQILRAVWQTPFGKAMADLGYGWVQTIGDKQFRFMR